MSHVGNSQRFVDLMDHAIDLAEARLTNRVAGGTDYLLPDQLESLLSALYEYKEQVLSGNLGSSEGGQVRLGLLRPVLDWGEPSGTLLYQTLLDIERYYENNW